MSQIIILSTDQFQELRDKMNLILSLIKTNSDKGTNDQVVGGKWIPEKEAQKLTGKKGTTLWKMRTAGELTFTKLNNRVYYDIESILAILEQNKKEAYK